jgi:hypothetical protein
MPNIKFIESSHRYVTDKGEDLISVSKFTERFKQKVDWLSVATHSAAKMTRNGTPTTAQELLDKWANKRDRSAEIGTMFHSMKESELLNSSDSVFYDTTCDKQECMYGEDKAKHALPINNLKNNTVYPELMIYDTDYMICGQSDKVIVVNNKIHIWDYKTDTEISFVGYSNKWTSPRKLLAPLEHLDDCNGNIYSIKMSMYMYLLWKANKGKYRPGDIVIEHVHLKRDPENDNLPVLENGKPVVLKTEKIKLPYRKREVVEMLKTIKTK